ncbi:MAG TPA: hypothetical protein VIV60_14310 [Polyangiaceae bacterium]
MRFLQARASLLAEARVRGLLNPSRCGGAWGERFLTLTAPHLPGDTIEQRIVRVLDAWKWFVHCLQGWQRDQLVPSLEWFRVFEWTPATDNLGHPHLHIWLFSPYLDQQMLLDWWAHGLYRASHGTSTVPPVVDIRIARAGVEQELVKYLTKDIDEHGHKLDPELYAKVYCALDQRRALQASRGFMARAAQYRRTCECGSVLPKLVRRKPGSDGTSSDGCRCDRCARANVPNLGLRTTRHASRSIRS